MQMALSTIDAWIRRNEHQYVCITGVHGVMECQRDHTLLEIHNRAGMVTPDGMPLVWIGRSMGETHVTRVYGPDLLLAVCQVSVRKGYRHFFYGGKAGVPDLLARRLKARFPGLSVAGTFSPPFRDLTLAEDAELIRAINDAAPDIVWVGLSTPKQERWMAAHIHQLTAPVLVGVGAAFDFHAGLKRQAPTWMQRSGLEWFFRVINEPIRLGPRYLLNNPLFVCRVAAAFLKARLSPRREGNN